MTKAGGNAGFFVSAGVAAGWPGDEFNGNDLGGWEANGSLAHRSALTIAP